VLAEIGRKESFGQGCGIDFSDFVARLG
jgi:hypothetical protein